MHRFRTVVALFAASLAAILLPSVPAVSTTIPDAEVRIESQAFEGPRGTIMGALRARCAPGFEVDELIVQFSQGDVVTPPQQESPFPCDGLWHRQTISSVEAFEPGPATVKAWLSVTDVETGEPGDPAFVIQEIYVRPAARIWLPRYGELKRYGVVALVVRARCDRPWVLADFIVSGTQDGNFGSQALSIPCDGIVRSVPVRLTSGAAPFRRGRILVDAALSLLDPEFFDPVTTATASRWVKVL